MKRFLSIFLMLAMVALPASAFNPEKSLQRRASHMIIFDVHRMNELGQEETGKALCSASALGKYALITANHCDVGETALRVDKELVDRPVLGRINDGEDHVILLVGGPAFKDTMGAFYSPDTYKMDKVGKEIFLYGDGAGIYPPAFRQGRMMGSVTIPEKDIDSMLIKDPTVYLIDVNIIGGDSGSAIYDRRSGNLVTLVTYGMAGGKFCGAYILAFKQADIDRAESFNGK